MTIELINEYIRKGKAKDAQAAVETALAVGISASEILSGGLIAAMDEIGAKFKAEEIFIPDVLIAARAMNKCLDILRPLLLESGVKPIGKAVICTVKGDIHDIGKNVVRIMLEGVGIECIDLGTDVGSDRIIEAVRESGADIVCLSSLLTTTMVYQKTVIDDLKAAGLRDKVKVMVGGAPVTEEFAKSIGADAFTPEAGSAAEIAKRFCSGK